MRMIATIAWTALLFTGCGTSGIVDVPSRNQSSRINYLVIHFTTENYRDSLALLTQPSANPVSAHYLIPEPGDDTYPPRKLRIHRLVDENRRAWHAGHSYWAGAESLNDRSIGIELVNRSYCTEPIDSGPPEAAPELQCFYPTFSVAQIDLLISLATDILRRYPEIDPVDIVGHADIAPNRKLDPGPEFPWKKLHEAGIGAWYDSDAQRRYEDRFTGNMPPLIVVQEALGAYGYRIEHTGTADRQTQEVLRAFQMHFRPSLVTAAVDRETVAILYALIEKYRPDSLAKLLEMPDEPATGRTIPAE